MNLPDLMATALVFAAAAESLTFVVGYHLLSRGSWRRDPMSRHVMAFVAVDAAVLCLTVARVLGGASLDTAWFAWTRLMVFAGVPWVIGWRVYILWRLYHPRQGERE